MVQFCPLTGTSSHIVGPCALQIAELETRPNKLGEIVLEAVVHQIEDTCLLRDPIFALHSGSGSLL